MNESEILKQITTYLTVKGVFHWRQNNIAIHGRTFVGLKGVSDIIAVINGRIFCIEIKKPKGKQSEFQKEFELNIKNNGGVYFITTSIDDLKINLLNNGIII